MQLKVLLVDDSPVVRRELAACLLALSNVAEVRTSDSVAGARRQLSDARFHLWIVDFQLGDGTALELLPPVISMAEGHRPRVLVISNHTMPSIRERCLEAGADGFFDKSSQIDAILASVEEIASGRHDDAVGPGDAAADL